jgi:hypothetical protein
LTRAGIVHLYFVCIHPFEDGNGRIGRALAEKSLAQNLGQPSLIALAYTIERRRKDYYAALEHNNSENEITDWLAYFAHTVLEAQKNTLARVEFYIAKTRFYERVRGKMNARQEKAVGRMFREGIEGFEGGLSAQNYISITRASRHGHTGFAGPGREGRLHQGRRTAPHAVLFEPRRFSSEWLMAESSVRSAIRPHGEEARALRDTPRNAPDVEGARRLEP